MRGIKGGGAGNAKLVLHNDLASSAGGSSDSGFQASPTRICAP